MIAERLQDSWIVQVSKIEQHTDRYEKKAEWKKKYSDSALTPSKGNQHVEKWKARWY
jgi:hypothetical protein